MTEQISIDFVAPPFAGHLFPQLELASGLAARGFDQIRFINTPESRAAVERCGFPLFPLLNDRSHLVFEIANTEQRVGSNPLRLHGQFKMNLSLMQQIRSELQALWQNRPPSIVITDFTVPVAGLLARQMGLNWWTSLPTLCVMETGDGTPAYLGGWLPQKSLLGRLRDRAGRRLIRTFKQTIHLLYRQQLVALGLESIYRSDGYESIYSSEKILGFGIREFEFPHQWPPSLEFVGPLTASPPFDHQPPVFIDGKVHIFVTLGTHVYWAKGNAKKLIQDVAAHLPDFVFHFTDGRYDRNASQVEGNFHCYGYVPYDRYVHRYDAVIHHGGTGIMYACIKNGVPVLVWPQDYDQFDHAARIQHHQIGLRLRPKCDLIIEDLRKLIADNTIRQKVRRFAELTNRYSAIDKSVDLIRSLFNPPLAGNDHESAN